MSETETTSTSTRKRATTKTTGDAEIGDMSAYEEALEKGYFGVAIDDADYTINAETPDITEVSVTHDLVPKRTAALEAKIHEAAGE
jgi:hypothetical protein